MANKIISTEYDYNMAITKDQQSGIATILSGEGALSAYSLVALVSGKFVAYVDATHSDHKLAVTKYDCDATSADCAVQVLLEGEIKGSEVTAGDAAVTDATVIERCMKSGIYFA